MTDRPTEGLDPETREMIAEARTAISRGFYHEHVLTDVLTDLCLKVRKGADEDVARMHQKEADTYGGLRDCVEMLKAAEREVSDLRERLETAERERDAAVIAFKAAHTEMDGAEFRLGCADAYGATRDAQLARAVAEAADLREKGERLAEALAAEADEKMWDGSYCFCGPNVGPRPHSAKCLAARAALVGWEEEKA